MRKDVYDPARLAGAFRAFQLALPTTGLRIHRRRRLHRASRTGLQRSGALSRSIHATPMGPASTAQRVLLGEGRSCRPPISTGAHHRCLGSQCGLPYSADRGKQSVNRQALDELKQQIPLMGYLQAHDWSPARPMRDRDSAPRSSFSRPYCVLSARENRERRRSVICGCVSIRSLPIVSDYLKLTFPFTQTVTWRQETA